MASFEAGVAMTAGRHRVSIFIRRFGQALRESGNLLLHGFGYFNPRQCIQLFLQIHPLLTQQERLAIHLRGQRRNGSNQA